jgi:hypothetical protein
MEAQKMHKCCYNKKVLASLGAVAVAIFLFVPSARRYIPSLAVLICPLSMMAMMFGASSMMGGKKQAPDSLLPVPPLNSQLGSPDRDAELQQLRAQVAALEANQFAANGRVG